jgi:tRNA A37 threonylcarbamoyladenosine dehydratase
MFGQENMDKLKSCRVAVFGIGGVGGHCAEALCRTGIGAIDLIDGDVVDVTNINRQLIADNNTIGRDKVDVMRKRLLDINPEASVNALKLFYLPETADEVDLSVYDYIVDAVDTIAAKLELVCRAAALGVPVISSMGAANKLDPMAFMVADIYDTSVCPMARIMRSELRKRGVRALKVVYSKEPPKKLVANLAIGQQGRSVTDNVSRDSNFACPRQIPASNAFVPPVAGLVMASEVVKDLTWGSAQQPIGLAGLSDTNKINPKR